MSSTDIFFLISNLEGTRMISCNFHFLDIKMVVLIVLNQLGDFNLNTFLLLYLGDILSKHVKGFGNQRSFSLAMERDIFRRKGRLLSLVKGHKL